MVKMTETPTLYPEPSKVEGLTAKGTHGYYRRPDNEWIVALPTSLGNDRDWQMKGLQRLIKYGEFFNGTMGGKPNTVDQNGNPWNPAEEPWRQILLRDGAREFPITQVLAFRWHLRPPYKEIKFPQLDGLSITNLDCPECDKGIFSSLNPQEAAMMLKQHLTSQINAQHKYTPTDLRELAREWGLDFDSGRLSRLRKISEEIHGSAPEPPDVGENEEQTEYSGADADNDQAPKRKSVRRRGKARRSR